MALEEWGMWYTVQLCTRQEFVFMVNEEKVPFLRSHESVVAAAQRWWQEQEIAF